MNYQVQGKNASVDFTQDIVKESKDEQCFGKIFDSVPTIDLPPCEIGEDQLLELSRKSRQNTAHLCPLRKCLE